MQLRGFIDCETRSHVCRALLCVTQFIFLQFVRLTDAACGDVPVQFRSVNESAPVGTVIQPVDASYTGAFSIGGYSQYTCYFSVSGGALILAKLLDLENLTSCSDGSTTSLASVPAALSIVMTCSSGSMETLIVNLDDINEFAPVFQPSTFRVNVSEAVSIGTFVIQLSSFVRDADKTNQVSFNFLLLAGADGRFSMPDSATSGIIRVAGSLDYDSGQRLYVLNVSAAELAMNSRPRPLTGFATVEVSLMDSDDRNPAFVGSGYSLSFMENDSSLLGRDLTTLPMPLEARDLDLGINQTVNYAIDSGNALNNVTFLEINSTSATLRLKTVLDRETLLGNPMWLRVRAFQTDKPELRTAVTFVSVTVTDKNDNRPVMIASTYNASLVENSPNGAFVTRVEASDPDLGTNATLIYRLTDASGAFLIEPATGIVRVANSALLDRETTSLFSLSVWAEESHSAERFASAPSQLTVTLADANDNAPVFALSSYTFSVSTAASIGTAVGAVSATDSDAGANADIVYSLTFASPTGSLAYFGINQATGSLTVTGQIADLAADHAAVFLLAGAQDQASPARLRLRATVAVTVTRTGGNTPATLTTDRNSATTGTASTSSATSAATLVTTLTSTIAAESAAPPATVASTSSNIAASESSNLSSSGGSALQTALIALCALMALLLAAALMAIVCFWKRRPPVTSAVAPSSIGTSGDRSGAYNDAGGRVKDGESERAGKKVKMEASNRHSSRINYSEFYFDDRDVSGNPIMVRSYQLGQTDFSDPRPPSYSQLPRVSK